MERFYRALIIVHTEQAKYYQASCHKTCERAPVLIKHSNGYALGYVTSRLWNVSTTWHQLKRFMGWKLSKIPDLF